VRVLGREPVFVVESVAALLVALSLFFNFNTNAQALVNAAIVAVAAVVQAWLVAAEKALPLLAGAVRAVIALVIGFGVDVPSSVQAGIMAVVAVLVAFGLRAGVVAPVALQPGAHATAVPPITRTTGGHV